MSRAVPALLAFCTLLSAAGCGGNIDDSPQEQDAITRSRSCQTNADCTSLQFCDTEASGSCGAKGICTARGVNLFCSNVYVGVCGCDGKTYANTCWAHKAGTSVDHAGACAQACNDNAGCGALQYCKKAVGQCSAAGTCQSRGVNLFCIATADPQCGCDGVTYTNGCYAAKAGASIAHSGACACNFTSSPIDGDTLAEMPFMDQTQTDFYTFTGNGTFNNNSGTFTWTWAPPCTRSTPRCLIAERRETGTFTTSGSTISLSYDNGNSATFDAQRDCHNALQLVGNDHGQTMTLVISTIIL